MAKRSKKYLEAVAKIDRTKKYSLVEAVELVKQTSISTFDGTVEVAFRMNLDQRKAEQNLRGAIVLPYGSGKTRSVLVLSKSPDKQKEALAAGADYAGDAEYLEKIKAGWFEFDIIVATPDMMGDLGRLGKILGPKGLMPNAKTGTVTPDVTKAVNEIKAGKVEYRVDKTGNIQVIAGKASFDVEKLVANITTIYNTILKLKPSTVKGVYFKNIAITTTMGPSVKVDSDQIAVK